MHGMAQRLTAAAGGNLRHVYDNVFGGFAARLPGAAVWRISSDPEIVSFERDEVVTIAARNWCAVGHWKCPTPPAPVEPAPDPTTCNLGGTVPWGVARIKAPLSGNCGLGIHVYVVDTGVDLDHPSLTPLGTSVDCTQGPCGSAGNGDDDNGHGTHVAGTVGARGQTIVGVAPGVILHSVKVLRSSGSGYRSDIIAGVNWIAGQARNVVKKPVVANLSISGSGSKTGTCSANGLNGTDAYHRAFCDAANIGVVFVVAAANNGADAETAVPAAYDDAVITVSATSSSDNWPSWSNWGDRSATWGAHSVTSAPVAIAAPGVSIVSTKRGGGTTTMSGTSMASPHVAGLAALQLKSQVYEPNYTAFLGVRAAILSGAASTGNFSNTSGHPHKEKFGCAAPC
jgi:subtilisin